MVVIFHIGVQLIYNVLLDLQKSDSIIYYVNIYTYIHKYIYIYIYILFQILFPFRLLQNNE